MEGLKFVKIVFYFSFIILLVFFISCQSPLFQIPYQAKNDLDSKPVYYGRYTSKTQVGQNENEKLNIYITNEVKTEIYNDKEVIITNTIYIWIGNTSFPSDEKDRFTVGYSNIDGEFPHYAFNNEEVVGKFNIINTNTINVSFATLYPPYLNIQNIICNKN